MKSNRIAGVVVAAALVGAVAVMTVGIPAGTLTSEIQARVERETGYRVSIAGASRLSLFPAATLTLHDVTAENPNDRAGSRISIRTVQAVLPLASVFSRDPRVTELTLTGPEVQMPLLRQRAAAAPPPAGPAKPPAPGIDRVIVEDGLVVMTNAADRAEQRIAAINADIRSGDERQLAASGTARIGGTPIAFKLKAAQPATDGQPSPVDLELDAPSLSASRLTAKAEVRRRGAVLQINGLSGTLGDSRFNGWGSVDLASKPLLKLDLDVQRVDVARAQATSPGEAWSDKPFDLGGLNYVDAEIRLSAAELNVGRARLAPAAVDIRLVNGVAAAQFARLGVYGGEAGGELGIDVSGRQPGFKLRSNITDVRALPLLDGLADFDKLDGKMQAVLALTAKGDSPRTIVSTLSGTTFVELRDGEILGLNLAKMIRNLVASTLDGWQVNRTEATDLAQLAASFRIADGKAETSELKLAGPLVRMTGAGTLDLPAKALAFKVEPRLVLTTQGQAPKNQATTEPVGFGVPVVIEGPWSAPRIYPDAAGMLDNPDAAYARLREIGKGLFGLTGPEGRNNTASPDRPGGDLGESIGKLIEQGLRSQGLDRPGAGGVPDQRGSRPSAPAETAPTQPDDATMNAIMKQLFGR